MFVETKYNIAKLAISCERPKVQPQAGIRLYRPFPSAWLRTGFDRLRMNGIIVPGNASLMLANY